MGRHVWRSVGAVMGTLALTAAGVWLGMAGWLPLPPKPPYPPQTAAELGANLYFMLRMMVLLVPLIALCIAIQAWLERARARAVRRP